MTGNKNTKIKLLYWGVVIYAVWRIVIRVQAFLHLAPGLWRKDDFNHYYATAWMLLHMGVPYGVQFRSTALATHFIWQPLVPSPTNPPFLAFVTMPLALITAEHAWMLWVTLNCIFAIGAFVIIMSLFGKTWTWKEKLLAALMFLSSGGFFANMLHAQIQPLIVFLICAGWYFVREGKEAKGAILWGITVAIKFYTWPLLLFFYYELFQFPKPSSFLGFLKHDYYRIWRIVSVVVSFVLLIWTAAVRQQFLMRLKAQKSELK